MLNENSYEYHEVPNIGIITEDSLKLGMVNNSFKILFLSDYFHPNDIIGYHPKLNLNNIWFEYNNRPKYSNKMIKSIIKFKYGKY